MRNSTLPHDEQVPAWLVNGAAGVAIPAGIAGVIGGVSAISAGLHPAYPVSMFAGTGACVLTLILAARLLRIRSAKASLAEEDSATVDAAHAPHPALHELEQEFNLLSRYSPDVFSRLSLDGRWLYMSPGIERVTGLPASHFIGRRMDEVGMPPELVAKWEQAVEALKQTGREQTVTWTYPTPDGVRHFEARAAPVRDQSGQFRSYIVITRDITERVQAEADIAHWRQVLSLGLEAAHAGAWEFDVKTQTSTWSDELCNLLGLADTDRAADYHRWLAMVHPDDRERLEANLRKVFESDIERIDDEYRLILPDGRERHFYDVGRVIRDADGRPERMVGFQLDITERVQGARALREEVEFRRSIIERATEGICVCVEIEEEPGLRFDVWNPRMEAITGYSVDEINRLGLFQAIFADSEAAEAAARCMERVRAGEDLDAEEWTITRKDGTRRTVLVSTKRVNVAGEAVAVLAILHDVTDERRATRALVESEERYRNIVETCFEGIWTIDAAGVTDFVNPQMADMLGYSVDEMLGRHLFDFMDAEARRDAEARLENRRKGESERHDFRFRHKSGRDVWTRIATTAMFDHHGAYAGALAIVTDITRLREAEFEAESTRALLKAAFDASPAGIIVARAPDAVPIMANSAALNLGGAPPLNDELPDVGERFRTWQIMHPDGTPCTHEQVPLVRAVSEGSTSKDVELLIQFEDGASQWVLANAAPVRDAEGQVIAGVMVLLDISGRIAAERAIRDLNADLERRVRERTAELNAANKELEGFSYSVSHDLRAPLRGIDGWSLALMEDCADELSDTAREYLERIRSESQRMGLLIDDLLRLARVSRSRFHAQRIDLSAIARRVADRIDEHDANQNKVQWVIEPGLVAKGDERLIEVALENLFANARKFTGRTERPRVEFGVHKNGRRREYFVRDNGAGFDMAFANKLFRPFQRLHSESEFAGTGIGLATVQRVVRRHGGTVRAEGETGRGATFYFTLS